MFFSCCFEFLRKILNFVKKIKVLKLKFELYACKPAYLGYEQLLHSETRPAPFLIPLFLFPGH